MAYGNIIPFGLHEDPNYPGRGFKGFEGALKLLLRGFKGVKRFQGL